MTEEIVVKVEYETPEEVVVVLDGGAPDNVDVDVSAVGLPGPPGPPGPSDLDALNEHINSPTPHPVYDNEVDLLVAYRNAKV